MKSAPIYRQATCAIQASLHRTLVVICTTIVLLTSPVLNAGQTPGHWFKHEGIEPAAREAFTRGWAAYSQQTPKALATSIPHFKDAVSRAPDFTDAYAALAAVYYAIAERGWRRQLGLPSRHEVLTLAYANLEQAMKNTTALAQSVQSNVDLANGRYAEALAAAEKATQLEPGNPVGFAARAKAQVFAGNAEDAVTLVDRALALNPVAPPTYQWTLGMAKFGLGEFADAVEHLERARAQSPDLVWVELAAAYAYVDRLDEAAAVLDSARAKQAPGYPLTARTAAREYLFKNPADRARFVDGLRKAGLN